MNGERNAATNSKLFVLRYPNKYISIIR